MDALRQSLGGKKPSAGGATARRRGSPKHAPRHFPRARKRKAA